MCVERLLGKSKQIQTISQFGTADVSPLMAEVKLRVKREK